MKYRLFIDEVGDPGFKKCDGDDHNHRFLSLTGVIIEFEHIQDTVDPQMDTLKSEFFAHNPNMPVIFHRKEIMNARKPFENLKDETVRKKFDHALIELLKSWKYTVVTVCIDKRSHKDKYGEWKYEPYHYCLEVMLERFLFFLNANQSVGDIIAESRGSNEDRQLKTVYARLWATGNNHINADRFQQHFTSKELKIKPKTKNISGLQLADLIAHPSRNEILISRGKIFSGSCCHAFQAIGIIGHNLTEF